MFSKKHKHYLLKLASLFSVVRGYNIFLIVVAQYLTSIYIFAPQLRMSAVLFDPKLFLIVLSSALSIASGYLINNFYDSEKDLINRPQKALLDSYVGQKTRLSVYFILNFLVVVIASAVSFRAVLFFSVYIFVLWFYSHKLKKIPLVGNITAAILAITPFFAIFIYYQNFDLVIFVHATYLFLVLLIRELVKDLQNLKGDFTQNYRTIPVVFGIVPTKLVITLAFLLTLIPTAILLSGKLDIGAMHYFFILSFVLLLVLQISLWWSKEKFHYLLLHSLLRLIIILGVVSIVLIDPAALLNKLF